MELNVGLVQQHSMVGLALTDLLGVARKEGRRMWFASRTRDRR